MSFNAIQISQKVCEPTAMLKTTIVDYVSVGGYVVYGDTFYPMAFGSLASDRSRNCDVCFNYVLYPIILPE